MNNPSKVDCSKSMFTKKKDKCDVDIIVLVSTSVFYYEWIEDTTLHGLNLLSGYNKKCKHCTHTFKLSQ